MSLAPDQWVHEAQVARLKGAVLGPSNDQYFGQAVKRWQDYSGKSAVLVATGQTFAEASERSFDGAAPPPPATAAEPTSLRGA